MRNKAGFTLIEIMVSLVLVGLIASIAGTAVVMGTRGYLFARENDAMTQKAQLALGRLSREFIELSNVKAVNDSQPYLIYEVPSRIAGVLAERRAVAKVGNTVQMFFNVPGTDAVRFDGRHPRSSTGCRASRSCTTRTRAARRACGAWVRTSGISLR